ncbi:MAG TPA: hypothetical protein DF296_15165 [Candidatus Margulisbacteria bacterium]|nr:hypothetical protein [Candidatus Margulisiibacteriota bacterium]
MVGKYNGLLRKRLIFVAKVAITFVFFVFILKKVDVVHLVSSFSFSHLPLLLVSLCLVPVYVVLKAWKWHIIVCRKNSHHFSISVKSYMAGLVGGLITPGRLGEVSRVFFLPPDKRLNYIPLVFFDKLLELIAVIVLALYGTRHFAGDIVFGIILAGIILLIAFLFDKNLRLFLFRLAGRCFSRKIIKEQIENIRDMLRDQPMYRLLMITFISYAIVLVQFYLFVSLHSSVSLVVIFLVVPIMMLSSAVPFTISGLGIREAAGMVLLATFGIPYYVAIQASLLLFLFDSVFPACIGAVIFLRGKNHEQAV